MGGGDWAVTDGPVYSFTMNIPTLYGQMATFTAVMHIIRLLWIVPPIWAVEGKEACMCVYVCVSARLFGKCVSARTCVRSESTVV